MKEYIERRVMEIAEHIILTGQTVRATAGKFKISKSTVHMVVINQNVFYGEYFRHTSSRFRQF